MPMTAELGDGEIEMAQGLARSAQQAVGMCHTWEVIIDTIPSREVLPWPSR
jgi:hypothetical protein